MEEHPFRYFVGVDWGDREHQVCCVTEGKPQQRRFEHSGRGIAALVSWLMGLCESRPETMAIAIETPHGVLVDACLEHGFAVFAINPKQVDRFRDRFSVAGAKDDRRDALVMASSLRTDPQAFRRLSPEDPLILQLREFTRAHRNLERENRRLSNQLRGQLNRFFPQILQLSKAADEPWVWSLLERFPSPDKVRRARQSSVKRILREHRISRVTAPEALAILKAPPLPVAEGVVEAATQHIALLLPRLRLVGQQRRQCEQRMARLIRKVAEAEEAQPGPRREHRDVEILLSQPGVGDIVAATVLAEAYQPLVQRNYHDLRTHGGIAPVTRQTGNSRTVSMRYACNQRLRQAFHWWGSSACHHDPRAQVLYKTHRDKGHTHARAVRAVMDRRLDILVACLESGRLYQPDYPSPQKHLDKT
jgi:transposase